MYGNKESLKTLLQVVIDKHIIHQNYAYDTTQEYTKYIDVEVAAEQIRFLRAWRHD